MKEMIQLVGIACASIFTLMCVLAIIALYGWQWLVTIIGCIPVVIITAAAIKYLRS